MTIRRMIFQPLRVECLESSIDESRGKSAAGAMLAASARAATKRNEMNIWTTLV